MFGGFHDAVEVFAQEYQAYDEINTAGDPLYFRAEMQDKLQRHLNQNIDR